MIAELREVALRLGLLTPRLLTSETYQINGGQYCFDQFIPVRLLRQSAPAVSESNRRSA
jgi:hypothetical protein